MRRLLCILTSAALLGAAFSTNAADASFLGLIKLQQFSHTPGTNPSPAASNGYSFQAFVVCSTNGSVTNATVSFKLGGGTAVRSLQSVTNGLGFRFEDYFSTQSALDAAYPAGGGLSVVEYTNTLHTLNDGIRRVGLNFWLLPPFVAISQPSTPAVANLAEAQAIDGAEDFVLKWNTLGSALTLVQFTVLDGQSNVVFATPIPFSSGALNGTSNSVVIPARTLPVGGRFEAHLTAVNPGVPNTNTYAGAIAVSALAKDTMFPMATLTAAPPRLSIARVLEGGVEVRLEGATNHVHELLASDGLTGWKLLVSTNLPAGELRWREPGHTTNAQRFFRGAVVR